MPIGMGLNYLVAQALYRKIADSDLPLTALVPSAIAHCHPVFVDTVRLQSPLAESLEAKIAELSQAVRKAMPQNGALLDYLETADNVVLDVPAKKLIIGANDLVSDNVSMYHAYWILHSTVRHLLNLAMKNTADSPQEFFKHVTFAVSPVQVSAAEDELRKATDVIESFLRADKCTDSSC